MPSLVATTSTPARKPFVRTHYVRTNYLLGAVFCLGEGYNYMVNDALSVPAPPSLWLPPVQVEQNTRLTQFMQSFPEAC